MFSLTEIINRLIFILRFLFSANYSPKSSFHLSSKTSHWPFVHTSMEPQIKTAKCSPRLFNSIFSQNGRHKRNGQPAVGEPVPPCWSDSLVWAETFSTSRFCGRPAASWTYLFMLLEDPSRGRTADSITVKQTTNTATLEEFSSC